MDLSSKPFDDTTPAAIFQHVAWAMRTAYHSQLRALPGQIAFGRDMVIHSTYMANWRAIYEHRRNAQIRNNPRENATRRPYNYEINEQVYIVNRDVQRRITTKTGPFTILRVHSNGTVTIQRSPSVTETISIRRLEPHF